MSGNIRIYTPAALSGASGQALSWRSIAWKLLEIGGLGSGGIDFDETFVQSSHVASGSMSLAVGPPVGVAGAKSGMYRRA